MSEQTNSSANNTTENLENILNLSFAQILQAKLHEIPNENPNDYLKYMYSTIHPGMIQLAVRDSKKFLLKENKKNGKPVNVYLTLGSDGMSESLYTGALASLLWLQEYIDIAKTSFNCSAQEIEITKKVLRTIGLPHPSDAKVDAANVIQPVSSCRHYASFLGSFVQWLTSGVTSFRVQGAMKTNMELSRFLTQTALNSFPSIPFTAYYIGSIKTDDIMELTEKISRIIDFSKFMTDESIELNQPKFVVQTGDAPLIGITGHPLANMVYGQESNGNVEWFGLFQESEEFNKICVKNGISAKDVKKYIYQTNWTEHQKKLAEGNKIATFVQNQNIIKEVFELRQKEYNVNNVETLDDENYELQ